jgi:hypothetical protein
MTLQEIVMLSGKLCDGMGQEQGPFSCRSGRRFLTTMEPCSGSFAVVRIPVDLGMNEVRRTVANPRPTAEGHVAHHR